MAPKSDKKTRAQVTTQVKTQRVTSLAPKADETLSSLEEAVIRMHHGVSLKANAELATNMANEELREELVGMEVDAHVSTGRIDDLPEIPAQSAGASNAKTDDIVGKLKDG
jgi:hypothetical protein